MKSLFKKTVILWAMLGICTFGLNSCNKDSDVPAAISTPLIETITYCDVNGKVDGTSSFQYDGLGRQTKQTNDETYYTFEYSGSTITEKDYDISSSDSTEPKTYTYILNEKGLIISSLQKNTNYSATYEYDNNEYLKYFIATDGASIIKYTYTVSDGNRTLIIVNRSSTIKSAMTNGGASFKKIFPLKNRIFESMQQNSLKSTDSAFVTTIQYKFFTDKKNTIDIENQGISFIGTQDKNPLKEEMVTYSDGSTVTTIYTYEYDGQGRIVKCLDSSGAYTAITYVK